MEKKEVIGTMQNTPENWKTLYSQIRDNDSLMKVFWDAIIEGYENGEEITVEIVCALLDNDGRKIIMSNFPGDDYYHANNAVGHMIEFEESISDRILDYAYDGNDYALTMILSSEAIDFGPSEQGIKLLRAWLNRGGYEAEDALSYLDEYDKDTLVSLLDDYSDDEDIVNAAKEALKKLGHK